LNSNIRVRIAPSPTGNLHIGTARTALFNYLFARHYGGKMILRIEDTDLQRSTQKSLDNILDGLRWLGMDWDEGPEVGGEYGPYFQSQKLNRYKEVMNELEKLGRVYSVQATEEQIEERVLKYRESNQYSQEREVKMIENLRNNPAYKFKTISKKFLINDLAKGEVEFDTELEDDLVIMKSDGMPTYNFAVVVDDLDMRISHVIRGDDHLSNTPKQLLIYDALGAKIPEFGHLGMIMAKDAITGAVEKMSKRHGATAITDYQDLGYLPESIFNYIAFLGWSPTDDKEMFTKEELIQEFRSERISKSPSIFDMEKLNWFNQNHIMNLDVEELFKVAMPHFKGLDTDRYKKHELDEILDLAKKRINRLSELPKQFNFFFDDEVKIDTPELKEELERPEAKLVLEETIKGLNSMEEWTPEILKDFLKKLQKELKLKTRQVMMPVRVSLTGELHGAELFRILHVLGKNNAVERITKVLASL